MKKSCVSVLLAVALMATMLFGVMTVPAFAANTATLTVTDAEGGLGDIVEISIDVSADSYLVNGDFDLIYDPTMLRYVADSCQATALLDGAYWASNEAVNGEVRISFASGESVGITAQGALFTLKFEIIDKYAMDTVLSLKAAPLRGCNGGDDFDIAATIKNGAVAIIGGVNPANPIDFLNTSNNYIAQGAENVVVNADGSWTVSGNVTLEPNLDVDIDDYPKIGLILQSTVNVRVTFIDGFANKTIHLENEWVNNPTKDGYFLAKDGYNGLGDFGGIYTWNKFPMKEGNVANVQTIKIELDGKGTATLRALYMSDGSPVSTAASTRTTTSVTTTTTSTSTTTTTTTTTTKVYPDVKQGTWYHEAVSYVSAGGYMSGYQNGMFGPADNLQRQDFVVILARVSGVDLTPYKNANGGLKDVAAGSYYAPAVAWAVDNGIITGYQNGKFGVGDAITREQVCTIFYRFKNKPAVDNAAGILAAFPDRAHISSFATDAVAWAVRNGVVSGMQSGEISPVTGASRAQIAIILMRMDQNGLL